tara:strand:+ start:724 stop:1782 length:1059 start_codon:yes stop_codon:yes gene_type:complete
MMHLATLIASFIFIYIIIYLKNNFSFLNEPPVSEKRKLHTTDVTRIGGIVFFSNLIILFYINDIYIKNIFIFGFTILILGLFEDIYQNISKYFRLMLLFSLCAIFVDFNNFIIEDFEYNYLRNILDSHNYLKIFFSILGLVILINGFNFIDGLNGLLLGTSIIILITFAFYSLNDQSELLPIIIALLIPIIILFLINFFGGVILAGDGGSYYIGFILGSISILMSNYGILGSFEVACIIFYPVMEITCSITRRILSFSNPLKPDGLHLHQLLFRVMEYKYKNKSDFFSAKNLNSLSSIIILINLCLLIISHYYLSAYFSNNALIFIMFCSVYLLAYNMLISYCYKKNLFISP